MVMFRADDGTHAAVIHGVIGFGVVERRLQNAGGENDFVHAVVVIGVDGWGSHVPLVAVNGLADFGEIARGLKRFGAAKIFEVRVALDFDFGIIAPFIGI